MAKKRKKAEFAKWFGPLLDALRSLGYSGKPKEVVEMFEMVELGVKPRIIYDVQLNYFEKFMN